MEFGVYRKTEGKTGVGYFYQVLFPVRHHTTGYIFIVYIPLRVEPEWAGTIRPCILEYDKFKEKFEFVGTGLPDLFSDADNLQSRGEWLDDRLSEAQQKLRDGNNDELADAIADARNILLMNEDK